MFETLYESWDLRISQARKDDRISPGVEQELKDLFRSYLSSALKELAKEVDKWVKRPDDAIRVPDVIREKARRITGE